MSDDDDQEEQESFWDVQMNIKFDQIERRKPGRAEQARYDHWLERGWPKTGTKNNCATCGADITLSAANKRYCSLRCKSKPYKDSLKAKIIASKGTRLCTICGSSFVPYYKASVMCSRQCQFKHNNIKRRKVKDASAFASIYHDDY